ncbi:Efflux transporter, RND family, MFP subunit [Verrucomicrobia bacterium]|nr:Efflux transporter, RND family, MFP subunit [Verrucomicrobiota bacterium]
METKTEALPAPPTVRAAPPQPRNRRRPWRLVALLVILLAIIGAALYYWFFMRPYESTDDAFIDADVVQIAPQVPGHVATLLVRDNQGVKQGELLLEIDPRDYDAGLAQAQASLLAAQTRLEQARAQVNADQAKVEQAQANRTAAQTEAERAQADLKRYQSIPKPAVSRTQFDLATAQARSNDAAVEAARSAIAAAQAQVTLSQAAIQTAAADVERNKAAVREAEIELSYTKVAAPIDGFVTHRTVQAGDYVQTGQALLALVPSNPWVIANFKETQLTQMHPGQPVTVHVDAYPNHAFHAHVDSIQRGSGARFSLLPPENATGNYVKVVQRVPVKILFDDPPDPNLPLGPGISVEPKVRVLDEPRK